MGFRTRGFALQECEWDEEFYQRFPDILGRFPISDLKAHYFTVVLEKPLDA